MNYKHNIKFDDGRVQQKITNIIQRKIDHKAFDGFMGINTTTAITTEPEPFDMQKIQQAVAALNEQFQVYKKDTIQMLASLGFTVMVNEFTPEGSKPVVMLPSDYCEAMAKLFPSI